MSSKRWRCGDIEITYYKEEIMKYGTSEILHWGIHNTELLVYENTSYGI